MEETPVKYVAKMVEVFREVKRVLRKDGTCWINIGDSYAKEGMSGMGDPTVGKRNLGGMTPIKRRICGELKPKDMVGIPWRLAFALQADGWYLRSDIIWSKPNPMPESVADRPTKSHEYIFLLAKSQRYYYDAAEIREPATSSGEYKTPDGWDTSRGSGGHGSFHKDGREKGKPSKQCGHSRRHAGFNNRWDSMTKDEQAAMGRNKRDVWNIATKPFSEAHFAVFPPEIPEICIKAGCPEQGWVLDPFAGSGTTLFVSEQLERNSIGIELNPEYCELIKRRMEGLEMNLFEMGGR